MRRAVVIGDARRQRHFALPPRRFAKSAGLRGAGFRSQGQLRLPRPYQVDIDFGEKPIWSDFLGA